MTGRYANRAIGIYAVELSVACSVEACVKEAEASVRATSCEDARVGVMRVLRWRGWQLGKHAPVLCPDHAPAPVRCVRCSVPTPPFYIEPVGSIPYFRDAVLDLKDHPASAPLCDGCRRWARDVVFAWHRRNREVSR